MRNKDRLIRGEAGGIGAWFGAAAEALNGMAGASTPPEKADFVPAAAE